MTANFFEFQEKLRTPPSARGAAGEEKPLSISELTAKITRVLQTGMPPAVLVRGEASNFNRNKSSGHLYFTLKDAEACIDCVMFRSEAARLKFEPENGMDLLAGGRVGVFPQRGRYQLYVNSLRPLGQGALERAFRQTREKLEREGLFSPDRKRPIPLYPRRIVLVTSRQAAGLADVLKVLRRFSWLDLMLFPVPVQGAGAAEKIASALSCVNAGIDRVGGADVILLSRGGGSLEDLWCFNEEVVARAVAGSRIPVVTGIGHEVDVSIADLAADYHAHTPTEAAQVITARWRGVVQHLDDHAMRLARGGRNRVAEARRRVESLERHETFRRPADRVNQLRQLLDDRQRALIISQERLVRHARDRLAHAAGRLERFLPAVLPRFRDMLADKRRQLDQQFALRLRRVHERMARVASLLQECHPRLRLRLAGQEIHSLADRFHRSAGQSVRDRAQRLDALSRQLEAVSPMAVLRRGYTITTRKKDGVPVRRSADVKAGERLLTRFADGTIESTADDPQQPGLFEE